MLFEWDQSKNKSNKRKHGISFETAALVFQDPNQLSVIDHRYNDLEERWQTIGAIDSAVLLVVHTVREIENGKEIIRLISAREATSREKRRYREG